MRRASKISLATMGVAALCAVGFMADAMVSAKFFEVVQKRRSFGTTAMTISKGDSIVFVNGDPFAHNVYSKEPRGFLDLGIQEEGDRQAVLFDKPGAFDLRCRIHPRMRLKVTVQ